MTELIIADVTIIQDEHGRYNLNALHQASEFAQRSAKAPNQWALLKSTRSLIAELESQTGNSQFEIVVGGDRRGTYAHEILAVEYAGWISPAFRIKVNQAFIDSRTGMAMPPIHDHRTKMAIDTLLRLDALEHDMAQHQKQLITHQQDVIKAQELAITALHGQQWLTIRQYVFLHDLSHQMPIKVQQDYARWLIGYCLEKGMPVYKAQTADRAWADERTYYIGAINDTLSGWLKRNQAGLSLVHDTTHPRGEGPRA